MTQAPPAFFLANSTEVFMRAILLSVVVVLAAVASADAQSPFKTRKDSISYGIGYDFGTRYKAQEVPVTVDALMRGFRDAYNGKTSSISEDATERLLQEFSQEMIAKQSARMNKQGEENRKEGEAFLAANKKKPGVVTLPDGLQYKIITQGTGPRPSKDTTVVCNYRGRLVNGKEFDSSYKHGEPATFRLEQVIKGWQEIIPMMTVGSTWEVYVPAELAYGPRAASELIGPNSTLIFELQLIGLK